MNTTPNLSGSSPRLLQGMSLLCALGLAVLPALAHTEPAPEPPAQTSTASEVGHAVGATVRDIGTGARDAGKAVGHGVVSAGKAVGHIARDAGVKIGQGAAVVGREIGHAARDGARGLAQGIKGEGQDQDESE